MPKTLFEHLSPDTGAKRILALDGGGVKGMLTLGMLKALEDELRRRAGGDSGVPPVRLLRSDRRHLDRRDHRHRSGAGPERR